MKNANQRSFAISRFSAMQSTIVVSHPINTVDLSGLLAVRTVTRQHRIQECPPKTAQQYCLVAESGRRPHPRNTSQWHMCYATER